MPAKTAPFTSLKWKIALITGAVLFLVHSLFSGFAIHTLKRQFATQRQETLRQHRVILTHLTRQAYGLLQQIGETIALVAENRPAGGDRIRATIDDYWSSYQLTWEIEAVQYFAGGDRLLRSWGGGNPVPAALVHPVFETERPRFFFYCGQTCLQYAAVPVLEQDGTTRVLVIGRSLANLILDFHRMTQAHVAILQHGDGTATPRIVAVTDPAHNFPILQRLPLTNLLRPEKAERQVRLDDRTLALQTIVPEDGHGIAFLVLDDVTAILAGQRRSLMNYLAGTVFSLVCGIGILILLLRRPLARLERATETLPLLAEGQHERLQEHLGERPKAASNDEIAILEANILQASTRLASLQRQVEERTHSLLQQTRTLQRERNFVQGLLDTAPLIILTQDHTGTIITVNRFGRQFLKNRKLPGASFDRLFLRQESERQRHQPVLAQLRRGDIERARFDTQLTQGEQVHHITWFHTRLGKTDADVPAILSIGLDITERKNAERRLAWLADHDPLTHLHNRRAFQAKLAELLDQATLEGKPLALLYFDLDQFKYVNDTCGHKTGDALLQIIANKLREVTRGEDVLARLGGDEFALVIYDSDRDTAVHIAEKVFTTLQSVDCQIDGQPFKVTVSIGIALFPQHGRTIQDLLANADLAMYQAKEAGRSRIQVYTPDAEFHKRLQQQLYWKDQIEQALAEERFVLHFQPILDIERGTISHYETLLRMVAPDGQIVAPGLFIPMAEQLGLIQRLDCMVLDKALDIHRRLQARGNPAVLSVNLSGHSLADEALHRHLQQRLSADDVDASRLIFEITETAAVSNFATAQRFIRKVKTLGCSFALDDFGVGFSSFYYLMHLPVDYVKIDGSFVKNLDHNPEDQALVSALADIAKRLGKKTVAEFVENEAILRQLKEIGVDYAQGYHIGRPAPTLAADAACLRRDQREGGR